MSQFYCSGCNVVKNWPHGGFTTGYGEDRETGKRYCFGCCAAQYRETLKKDGKGFLYLDMEKRQLTDWGGKLAIPVRYIRKGRHNIARVRYDVWFTFEGAEWHGVQCGDNTQICHLRRTK